MKSLDEVIEIITCLKEEIKQKYKAEIIGLFGSFARGEQKKASDVDILINFYRDATLFDLVRLSMFLEEKLRLKVDLVPQDTIRKELKEKIMNEVIYI